MKAYKAFGPNPRVGLEHVISALLKLPNDARLQNATRHRVLIVTDGSHSALAARGFSLAVAGEAMAAMQLPSITLESIL